MSIQRSRRAVGPDSENGFVRVLILTASVGEGHDLPARMLADQLRAERDDVEVIIADGLAPMGRLVNAISDDAPGIVFFRFQWIWDLGFWLFARAWPTRRLTQLLLARLGRRGLLHVIAALQPDVVVSTYPHTTEVLGRLRRRGLIEVPVCSAITDLAALDYWATPGVDVHLITHPESAEEVYSVAGADAQVHCVHGLTSPAFLVPPDPETARDRLGLPSEGKIVLVSGGGWGVGDVGGAVDEAVRIEGVARVVCLCGRNESLRKRLSERFAGVSRVRIEGFTDRMPDWMAAADVLIHSTGGLTVLEALMCGLPAISYGWGRGHVRVNNAAFRRFGLADVVSAREHLGPAVARAFERGRSSVDGFHALPSAASIVLAAVDAWISAGG